MSEEEKPVTRAEEQLALRAAEEECREYAAEVIRLSHMLATLCRMMEENKEPEESEVMAIQQWWDIYKINDEKSGNRAERRAKKAIQRKKNV